MNQTFTINETAEGCISDAKRRLRQTMQALPEQYFDGKDARSYRFNNITRLIETYANQAKTENERVAERLIAEQIRNSEVSSLYVGVPWCEQICAFCNFAYSTSTSNTVRDEYLDNLQVELALYQEAGLGKVNSIYFGGGTPTALDDERFERHLTQVIANTSLLPSASITCEATINTLDSAKLAIMHRCGVTRLSVGVQSLDDGVRERARLIRTSDEVVEKLREAKSCFSIFNADLIYGYPYQSLESWYQTVCRIAELDLPSITTYRLEVKDRTIELKRYNKDQESFSDEMTARLQYFIACQVFEAHGYVESPLGWWIRADRHQSDSTWHRHMSGWSKAIPYIGLGQGAFSLYSGLSCENYPDINRWTESLRARRIPAGVVRPLDLKVPLLNRILRVLRTYRRLDFKQMEEDLALVNLREPVRQIFENNEKWGLLSGNGDEYELTEAGRALVHWLLDELVTAQVSS